MMPKELGKIAITGASKGLGAAIYEDLSKDFDCLRTTSRLEDVHGLCSEIEGAGVLINNACAGAGQLELLDHVYGLWKSTDRLIINIGSRAANPNISLGFMYSTYKNALNHYSSLTTFKDRKKRCRITTINPGLLGSHGGLGMTYHAVVSAIRYILGQDVGIEISRIDLHNASPYEDVQDYKRSAGGKWKAS